MPDMITFRWGDKQYTAPRVVQTDDLLIRLPDGTILKVLEWTKDDPPQPMSIGNLRIEDATQSS
ncbi:hypothetical protein A3A71_03720 [Candidatus Berkelbacteria bacterium RIFCSPLOWO2_01_FULL_50_28]|uniref:Uncharacterized protein n=1 Tax=Candidatus Berkelbacteria bacterium RIFCSPLOWO2_01_FULL_50_28 TaxID=1797471 RepID=A0A1F5EA44_9BACT|nr:MAG: hypothetical protein A3F39_01085 [Candidatus Berkelbacteria bacterium RIFCSPHIGHO2_12_FULL_50_11]OGD64258.1 MAG: hypothetical protein A3A71_03720 [Candidatus Berkelbacteria bacterium RIFCSPLOWO2_01_FULL_50_28]